MDISKISRALVAFSASLILSASSLRAAGPNGDVTDPDPELELKSFQVPEGFQVNLFASDPLLAKPVQMNFDPQGRLWVATSESYPQAKPGEIANDKVILLEDKDGTGKAGAAKVFADHLVIPTGVLPGDGGVYVANSTELVHLSDTDGDGKADKKRVMLSGFGVEDTHHIIHTFRWGPGGQLFFEQSIYIHSAIETPWGLKRLRGGGVWDYRPKSGKLDIFVRGLVNGWGHTFDYWGQSFGTDGAGGEGVNYFLPGAIFTASPEGNRVLKGFNPGSPKYAGAEILSGRHIPDDWQGNLITNDFRANRVCRFEIRDDGAGFSAKQLPDLIKTNDRAFRPIDIKMGPDGAIYIADWYNPIINHGEVDFRDARRDHTHGRIWRVTVKDRPLVERPKLVGQPLKDVVEALKAPEAYTRMQAKRVMAEADPKEVVPVLAAWVKALSAKDKLVEHHRLEGLWAYQSIDVVEPALLAQVLQSKEPSARAAAVRVVSQWHDRLDNPVELLSTAIQDENARVRLEAVRALAAIPSARAFEIAAQVLDKPMDPFLDYALARTADDLQPLWAPALQAGQITFGGQRKQLEYAMQAARSPALLKKLIEQLKAGKLPADAEQNIANLTAAIGDKDDAGAVLDLVLNAKGDMVGRQAMLLEPMLRAARERQLQPAGDLARLKPLIDQKDEPLRAEAIRLAGAWKVEALREDVAKIALAADTSDTVRLAAVEALADLKGPQSTELLQKMSDKANPPATRVIAVAGLAAIDLKDAAARASDVLTGPGGADPAPLLAAFLARQGGSDALSGALASKKVPADTAKLALRYLHGAGRDEPKLTQMLTDAAGLVSRARQLTPAEMKQLQADVLAKGDAARGEIVFRRAELSCFQCHAISGAGPRVAPDLASVGAASPFDYVVDAVLLPNKAVKEGYNGVDVTTKNGDNVSGVKLRQTATDLVLRNTAQDEIVIPLNQIQEQRDIGSLMPSGLVDTLTDAEFVDLMRFLSELGKPGPYAAKSGPVVRRWQVLDPVPADLAVGDSKSLPAALAHNGRLLWRPAYSLVSGSLPLDDLTRAKLKPVSIARFQLDVTSLGEMKLAVNVSAGLTLWLDETPVQTEEFMMLHLERGIHTVTVQVDHAARGGGAPLWLDLEEVKGSTARAQVVGGK